MKKANRAANKIILATNNSNVHVEELDLASLKSIKSFADRIRETYKRVDILINNAGLVCDYQKTKDGFEMQFGTMHLGHFYLTYLLIDLLKANAPSRIVNVSALAHKGNFK